MHIAGIADPLIAEGRRHHALHDVQLPAVADVHGIVVPRIQLNVGISGESPAAVGAVVQVLDGDRQTAAAPGEILRFHRQAAPGQIHPGLPEPPQVMGMGTVGVVDRKARFIIEAQLRRRQTAQATPGGLVHQPQRQLPYGRVVFVQPVHQGGHIKGVDSALLGADAVVVQRQCFLGGRAAACLNGACQGIQPQQRRRFAGHGGSGLGQPQLRLFDTGIAGQDREGHMKIRPGHRPVGLQPHTGGPALAHHPVCPSVDGQRGAVLHHGGGIPAPVLCAVGSGGQHNRCIRRRQQRGFARFTFFVGNVLVLYTSGGIKHRLFRAVAHEEDPAVLSPQVDQLLHPDTFSRLGVFLFCCHFIVLSLGTLLRPIRVFFGADARRQRGGSPMGLPGCLYIPSFLYRRRTNVLILL